MYCNLTFLIFFKREISLNKSTQMLYVQFTQIPVCSCRRTLITAVYSKLGDFPRLTAQKMSLVMEREDNNKGIVQMSC